MKYNKITCAESYSLSKWKLQNFLHVFAFTLKKQFQLVYNVMSFIGTFKPIYILMFHPYFPPKYTLSLLTSIPWCLSCPPNSSYQAFTKWCICVYEHTHAFKNKMCASLSLFLLSCFFPLFLSTTISLFSLELFLLSHSCCSHFLCV